MRPVVEGMTYPASIPASWQMTITEMPAATLSTWLTNWNTNISGYTASASSYANTSTGEDLDWLFTPPAEGMYYGYMATGNTAYVAQFAAWADALIARQFVEPDGYPGWPRGPNSMLPYYNSTGSTEGAAGTTVDFLEMYYADSFLGEAAACRVIALMGWQMVNNPGLSAAYGAKGASYINLAITIYNKWMARGGWRPCDGWGPGECTVSLSEGLDPATGFTTWANNLTNPGPEFLRHGERVRQSVDPLTGQTYINEGINNGFSHPANKSNEVNRWMLAMWDVTGDTQYLTHAQRWFQQMQWRTTAAGTPWSDYAPDSHGLVIWNYWQPNGPWDYCANATQTAQDNPTGSTGGLKLGSGFVNVVGYYQLDSLAIAEAWEHGVVFAYSDIQNLINITTEETTWPDGAFSIFNSMAPYSPTVQTARVNAETTSISQQAGMRRGTCRIGSCCRRSCSR